MHKLPTATNPFKYHGRTYTSNFIVSSAHSKYVFYIYRDVDGIEKFDA
jgi:hypothetical protein